MLWQAKTTVYQYGICPFRTNSKSLKFPMNSCSCIKVNSKSSKSGFIPSIMTWWSAVRSIVLMCSSQAMKCLNKKAIVRNLIKKIWREHPWKNKIWLTLWAECRWSDVQASRYLKISFLNHFIYLNCIYLHQIFILTQSARRMIIESIDLKWKGN